MAVPRSQFRQGLSFSWAASRQFPTVLPVVTTYKAMEQKVGPL